MKKTFFIFFILSLLLYLSKSIDEPLNKSSVSKLIGKVREEIVDKCLLYLPKKSDVKILEMGNEFKKLKAEYSLKDEETAYLVFKWLCQNFVVVESKDKKGSDSDSGTYTSGKGTPKGISSLFNTICAFLELKTDTILGYLKTVDMYNADFKIIKNYPWNYIEIDGQTYLIDISMVFLDLDDISRSKYSYCYFGTVPEIFIRSHFPNESKWQLLSKPYTFEKFESMALLVPLFYLFGFKTVSPDTNQISGSGKITLTSDKSIPAYKLQYWMKDDFEGVGKINESEGESNGIIKLDFNIDYYKNFKPLVYFIEFCYELIDTYTFPILFYFTNYTKVSYLDFNPNSNSILNIANENYLASNVLKEVKGLRGIKSKNIRGLKNKK